jgi:hypothetical protein
LSYPVKSHINKFKELKSYTYEDNDTFFHGNHFFSFLCSAQNLPDLYEEGIAISRKKSVNFNLFVWTKKGAVLRVLHLFFVQNFLWILTVYLLPLFLMRAGLNLRELINLFAEAEAKEALSPATMS